MVRPTEALAALRQQAPLVARLCVDHDVILLTAFGSVLSSAAEPHDLDLGVLFEYGGRQDILGLRDGLVALTGFEAIDIATLNNAGPVIRERALIRAEVLFERRPSIHANAAIAATMERLDTDWLRQLALREMAR